MGGPDGRFGRVGGDCRLADEHALNFIPIFVTMSTKFE
jgi:hypothetical protein